MNKEIQLKHRKEKLFFSTENLEISNEQIMEENEKTNLSELLVTEKKWN